MISKEYLRISTFLFRVLWSLPFLFCWIRQNVTTFKRLWCGRRGYVGVARKHPRGTHRGKHIGVTLLLETAAFLWNTLNVEGHVWWPWPFQDGKKNASRFVSQNYLILSFLSSLVYSVLFLFLVDFFFIFLFDVELAVVIVSGYTEIIILLNYENLKLRQNILKQDTK